jgi:hypothetical protein
VASDTAPTTGIGLSRSVTVSTEPVFGNTICQICVVLYNICIKARVPGAGAGTGAAKAVAGIRASRKVEKRMAIDACDESEETSGLHSFCQLQTKTRLINLHTWFLWLVVVDGTNALKYNIWAMHGKCPRGDCSTAAHRTPNGAAKRNQGLFFNTTMPSACIE